MLHGMDFIVFSDDWGRHPFSCQHLMKYFLESNRILWVNTIGMRRPRFTIYDLKRSVQKVRSFFSAPVRQELPQNLTIINPFMLPFTNPIIREFNRRSVISSVRERMGELGFSRPVFLTTLPNAADYVGAFDEEGVVYYCVDDFTLWPGVDRKLVGDMECRLLEQADMLVCSSGELAALKETEGLPCRILPHGVDLEHFSRAERNLGEARSVPGELKSPVIGYFGLLGEWVDLEILERIASADRDWTLLLVGNVTVDIDTIRRYPNVTCTGPVPYEVLPEYVRQMDVLVLPYTTAGRGKTITPLKLREYMATGKPVVSTAIPECCRFSDVIRIAAPSDFLDQIRLSLAEPPEFGEKRRNAVASDSWLQRAEQLSVYIDEACRGQR